MNVRRLSFAAPALVSLMFSISVIGCATTREFQDPELQSAGKATRVENDDLLAFSVSQTINAPADKVWGLISDATKVPEWYSEVTQIDGKIADGEEIDLHSNLRPDEPFHLKVTIVEEGRKMTWEDGMPMGLFAGVRTYTLTPKDEGTTVVTMSEVFSGGMLGMIKGELPDFRSSFEVWAADLKKAAEAGASTDEAVPAADAPTGAAATEPAATEPAATEPAATEPAATEPAATEPAATEPAATEPGGR